MNTIDELLNEYQVLCRDDLPWEYEKMLSTRQAVDAEIKRMQDRITELERDNYNLYTAIARYDMALLKALDEDKAMSETT